MTTITKPLTEDELLSTLERNIDQADTYTNSEIGEQRDKGYRYYYGNPLGNEREGRSQHVSMDVFDGCEAVKAVLMETFSANQEVCVFDPIDPQDLAGAKSATALVNWIFYKQNDGNRIIHDVLHDALVAKTGVVKRYWKDDYEYQEENFEGIGDDELAMMVNDPMVELNEIQSMGGQSEIETPNGTITDITPQMHTGSLLRRINTSKVCVEVIEPENFLISPRAKDIKTADFVSHRTSRTRGEILAEGISQDIVARLDDDKTFEEDGSIGRDSIDQFRHDDMNLDDDRDREYVTIYESYLKKYDPELNACVIIKCIHSRKIMLDQEVVSEMPFQAFTPFPLPHRFHGMSLADVLCDLQKTQSSLKRSVIDHVFSTNTSRYVANLSLVKNPRDLLDNRVGAVIDVNSPQPDAVIRPLPIPQMNQGVYQAIENFEQEKEQRSGSSRMSRGMDNSAVSKQNSSDLITTFMNASNRRIMVMARHFAESFLKPLMVDVYRIAIEYESQEKMMQLDGQFVPIDPRMMKDRTEMTVSVALTPDEKKQEAQLLLSMDGQFAMQPDPTLGGLYSQNQRYALLARAYELLGIKEGGMFIQNPQDPNFQQQMQMQQQQMEEEQQKQEQQTVFQAGMTARQVAVMEGQLELEITKEANRVMSEGHKQQHSEEMDETELLLKAELQKHKMEVDEKELELEEQQKRPVSVNN